MAKDRFRHIEIRIGILVLIVVLGTIISMLYVGYKKDLFAKRFTLTILSPTGEKLTKGMPVKLEGFRMGEVTAMDLNDEGQIVLSVKILSKYHKWIRTGLTAGSFSTRRVLSANPFSGLRADRRTNL